MNEVLMLLVIMTNKGVTSETIKFNRMDNCLFIGKLIESKNKNKNKNNQYYIKYDFECILK